MTLVFRSAIKASSFTPFLAARHANILAARHANIKTLGVFSSKGGTGKTTIALHLAVAAVEAGLKVVIADLDPQHSAFAWRQGRRNTAPEVVMPRPNTLEQFQSAAAKQGFDLMIVDTPPMVGPHIDEALRVSDFALAVTRPNALDIWAVRRIAEIFQDTDQPSAFVLNQAPPKRAGREASDVVSAAAKLRSYGAKVAPTGMRSRRVYSASIAEGLCAQELRGDSAGAAEVTRLFDFVWKRLETIRPELSISGKS